MPMPKNSAVNRAVEEKVLENKSQFLELFEQMKEVRSQTLNISNLNWTDWDNSWDKDGFDNSPHD